MKQPAQEVFKDHIVTGTIEVTLLQPFTQKRPDGTPNLPFPERHASPTNAQTVEYHRQWRWFRAEQAGLNFYRTPHGWRPGISQATLRSMLRYNAGDAVFGESMISYHQAISAYAGGVARKADKAAGKNGKDRTIHDVLMVDPLSLIFGRFDTLKLPGRLMTAPAIVVGEEYSGEGPIEDTWNIVEEPFVRHDSISTSGGWLRPRISDYDEFMADMGQTGEKAAADRAIDAADKTLNAATKSHDAVAIEAAREARDKLKEDRKNMSTAMAQLQSRWSIGANARLLAPVRMRAPFTDVALGLLLEALRQFSRTGTLGASPGHGYGAVKIRLPLHLININTNAVVNLGTVTVEPKYRLANDPASSFRIEGEALQTYHDAWTRFAANGLDLTQIAV